MSIEVRNLSKQFGTFAALRDVSLEVRSGRTAGIARPFGFRKNHFAARDRRAGNCGYRTGAVSR